MNLETCKPFSETIMVGEMYNKKLQRYNKFDRNYEKPETD